MNHTHQTLLYLKKHYAPFTQLNIDTLNKIQDGIRVFRLFSGEQVIIKTHAIRDFIYITNGTASIQKKSSKSDTSSHSSFTINAHSIGNKPVAFGVHDGYIIITAINDITAVHADMGFINSVMPLKMVSEITSTNNSYYFKRLLCLKRSNLCKTLPIDILQSLAQQFEEIKVKKGLKVITQNQKALFFYIIMDGEAEVLQKNNGETKEKVVAHLNSGSSFGEQGLITEENRNASIRMTKNGTLLKLSKQYFDELVANSIIRYTSPKMAKEMLQSGVNLIDVRTKEEYDNNIIPHSILIPLPELRKHINHLDINKNYLIICSANTPSAAASFILKQYNIKSSVVTGGINQWIF